MDSALSLFITKMTLSISPLTHFASAQLFHRTIKCFPPNSTITTSSSLVASSFSSTSSTRSLSVPDPPKRCRFRSLSASAASGADNSEGAGELSALSSEVVSLNVEGMMCEGCADSVKKLLESRPQVSSASVSLTAETATVWPAPAAKAESNWHNKLGGALAEHLTNCGFRSSLQELAGFSGRSGR